MSDRQRPAAKWADEKRRMPLLWPYIKAPVVYVIFLLTEL